MTYILVPLTFIVWVLIVLKVVNFKGSDELVTSPLIYRDIQEDSVEGDNYELLLDYDDPFLVKKSSQYNNDLVVDKKISTKNKQLAKRPQINYTGLIINQQTSCKKINISINGKYYLMSQGDKVDDLTLDRIYPDSIRLTYNNESFFIRKPQ